MSRTFKLGPHSSTGSAASAMAYPTGFDYTSQKVGGTHNTSASVYQDTFDRRLTWQYRWRMLTATELAQLKTEFDRDTSLDMSPVEVDDGTYYQVVITSGFDVSPVYTGIVGSPYFDLALTFQET
jgi:hypothetical protein